MRELEVRGDPKPRKSVKSTVIFRKGGVEAACAAIRRGARGKAAKVAILQAFFVNLYQVKTSDRWRKTVEAAADRAPFDLIPAGTPVVAHAMFWLPRPKAHYGTGRNAEKLKAKVPAYPINAKAGDATNLWKLAEDALNKRAYADDCQVVDLIVKKRYAELGQPTGCRIGIAPVVV